MATEYKLPFTAAEIRERLEKINKLVSTVNGVAPDANGNIEIKSGGASSWNDLADKPFGENATIIGDTFTWDGNINDRTYVKAFIEDAAVYSVHVSDIVPSNEEIKKGGYYFINGNPIPYTADNVLAHEDGKSASIASGSLFFIVFAREDNLVLHSPLGDMRFPKKGMYFGSSSDMNLLVTGLSINDYIFIETEIEPLDTKYLPEHLQFGPKKILVDNSIEFYGSAKAENGNLIWDGDTTGLITTSSTNENVESMYFVTNDTALLKHDSGISVTYTAGDKTVTEPINLLSSYINPADFDKIKIFANIGESVNITVVAEDNFTYMLAGVVPVTFPKKGIYIDKIPVTLSIDGYEFKETSGVTEEEIIKPLDIKYLPESHQFRETTVTKDVITWDGKTDGLDSVANMLYKISDAVPSFTDLQNGGIIKAYSYGDEEIVEFTDSDVIDATSIGLGINIIMIYPSSGIPIFIAIKDSAIIAFEGGLLTFEKAGVYFPCLGEEYISYFAINNYTFASSVIKPFDTKYLPKSHQFGGSITTTDTLTWDRIINENDINIGYYYLIKLTSYVPTLEDLANGGTVIINVEGNIQRIEFTHYEDLGNGMLIAANENWDDDGNDWSEMCPFILPTELSEGGITASKGIYTMGIPSIIELVSFNINNYTFTVDRNVKTIDKMYLPSIKDSDLNIFEKVPTYVMTDELTWNGDTEGLYSCGGTAWLVSNTVPTLAQLHQGGRIRLISPSMGMNDDRTFTVITYNDLPDVAFLRGADEFEVMVVFKDNAIISSSGTLCEKAGIYFYNREIYYTEELILYGYSEDFSVIKSQAKLKKEYLPASNTPATFTIDSPAVGTFHNGTVTCDKSLEDLIALSLEELYNVNILAPNIAGTDFIAKPVSVLKTSSGGVVISFLAITYLGFNAYYIKPTETGGWSIVSALG